MLTRRNTINTGLLVCPKKISFTFSGLYFSAAARGKANKPFAMLQLVRDRVQLLLYIFPSIYWFVSGSL